MSMATILAQAPAGVLIDRWRNKKQLLLLAIIAMSAGAFAITIAKQFYVMFAIQIVYGAAAAIAGPCLVAISLGLVGNRLFASRVARNEAFNHIGNVLAALFIGWVASLFCQDWIFYSIALFGLGSIVAACFIKGQEINNELACGANTDKNDEHSDSIFLILSDKRILAFAIAVVLFHLANAALLPLAGQYLCEGRAITGAAIWISGCVIAAQLVMVPTSLVAGKLAEKWGRKPVFLIALAALPLRAFLFTLSNSPWLVIPVQLLDGIGAGIFGVLVSVIVADLTEGTGKYNTTRGLIITAQGIGAALSNILAGIIVARAGYSAGFICLALIALLGLLICYLWMPETRKCADLNSRV
jgi:MFS family permease